VVGVSVDSQDTADRFRRELDLPFAMVGDPSQQIVRAYGVRWPLVGWARRTTFVVGPDARVVVAYHSEMKPEEHAARACAAVARGPSA
jgi:peroxiredoxin Q/BCP